MTDDELMTREMEMNALFNVLHKVVDPFMKKRGYVCPDGGMSTTDMCYLSWKKDKYNLYEIGASVTVRVPTDNKQTKTSCANTENEQIDLLIAFFEQERDYTREVVCNGAHSKTVTLVLNKRIEWFNTLIGTLQEVKNEEGIKMLKEAIEREKQRKSSLTEDKLKCANCGNEEFYNDQAPNNHRMGVGDKYICTKCGFKATKELHRKGNLKKIGG